MIGELMIAGACGLLFRYWLYANAPSSRSVDGKVVMRGTEKEFAQRARQIEEALRINQLLERAYLAAGRQGHVKTFLDTRLKKYPWPKIGEPGFPASEAWMRRTCHLPSDPRMSPERFVELIQEGKIRCV